jgi:hypothetical protein
MDVWKITGWEITGRSANGYVNAPPRTKKRPCAGKIPPTERDKFPGPEFHPPNMKPTVLLALLVLPSALGLAGQGTDLKPILATPAKVTAEDTFTGTALAKTWSTAKGDWQPRDGTLVGKEKPEDKHAAVCALNVPNHDSIIRFSFKLDGARGLSLSYNHPKGHLFRVNVTPTAVTVATDKDKNDPNSKAEPIGKAETKFEPGQWYTMQVEVKGQKVAVQTDSGVKIEGSNPALDVDKTGYRFVTTGESLVLANVKAWDVVP